MAEPRLIEAYLTELRYSVAKLDDADESVEEVADHLYTALERLIKEGVDMTNAESQALGQFGSASLVSQVFNEEAKRGGAISTSLTRRAGLAALVSAPLIAAGQVGNEATRRGFLDNDPIAHGIALSVLAAGFGAFIFALWGIRKRHGGMGRSGRIAFWWFVAAPILSIPAMYAAPLVLAFQWLLILGLLGEAMLRARVLPLPAVVMFTVWPILMPLAVLGMTAAGLDAGPFFLTFLIPVAVGLMWVGWAMWREPALDVRSGNSGTPLAAA